jgi:hypothetical protein
VSAVPPRPDDHELRAARPAWRRASVGWLLLHLAIGIGLTVALLWLEIGAIASAGRDLLRVQNVAPTDTAMMRASAITLVAATVGGFGGWIFFVYARVSTRLRAWGLAAGMIGSFVIALAFLGPLLPPVP